jgi:hypothetical protein
MYSSRTTHSILRQQRGAVFIVMLVIMIMGVAAFLVSSLNSSTLQIKRDEVTADALAQAKEALIGRAASDSTMPGRLPCPEDTSLINSINEGQALSSCTLPAIGRLPWKSLGLGDLRDGNGDKLWYVLSAGFRSLPLNSDTPALLTVDGVSNLAVAIIFSAGTPINGQSRPVPTSSTPPDRTQYLELSNNTGGNTFVSTGSAGTINDRLLLVTHDELFSVVEKRVAGEVRQCLNDYALNNSGRYPWAVPLNDLSYTDQSGLLFGRIPDTFTHTVSDGATYSMAGAWGTCNTHTSNTPSAWWLSWREMVFYGLADAYKPSSTTTSCPNCLTVNPPSTTADKKFVVIVAGKALATTIPAQVRANNTDKSTLTNYLEPPNTVVSTTTFAQSGVSATFNDTVVSQQ